MVSGEICIQPYSIFCMHWNYTHLDSCESGLIVYGKGSNAKELLAAAFPQLLCCLEQSKIGLLGPGVEKPGATASTLHI